MVMAQNYGPSKRLHGYIVYIYIYTYTTEVKHDIAPEKLRLEDDPFLLGPGNFSGSILNFWGVYISYLHFFTPLGMLQVHMLSPEQDMEVLVCFFPYKAMILRCVPKNISQKVYKTQCFTPTVKGQ